MHPFFFGSSSRRLFGIYEPAVRSNTRRRAALLCHPWGAEYLHAHRSMRQLAKSLSEAGLDSLRFDYYGTGDSGGTDVEGDLSGWRRDIQLAAEELASLSGAHRLTLIGLRLGATLAAQVAPGLGPAIDGLVLWDPVVHGGEYSRELRLRAVADSPGTTCDVLGFPFTARLQEELADLSLQPLAAAIPCPIRAIASQSVAACEELHAALAPATAVEVKRIESPPVWLEDWRNTGFVPVKILRQIVQWTAS